MRRFNQILHSSRAAIDLASIMVGVIIIGLIGGVISATVFAVIPWSQDNAAKNQLESIHTAENAFFGLSSDSNQSLKNGDGTVGSFKNTFTGSAILDANSLLTISKDGAYCVIPASTGKDYHAYVKSGSGKWFYALNSKKSPQLLAADINPCVSTVGTPAGQTPGTVDTNIDDGTADVPTTAVKPPVATYDFENGQQGFTPSNFAYSSTMSVTKSYYHSGKQSLYVFTDGAPSDITRGTSVTVSNIEAGQTYRVSGWIYWDQRYTNSVSIDVVAFGNSYRAMKGTSPAPTYKWTQFSFDVTPTSSRGVVNSNLVFNSRIAAYFDNTIYLDDIAIEKI